MYFRNVEILPPDSVYACVQWFSNTRPVRLPDLESKDDVIILREKGAGSLSPDDISADGQRFLVGAVVDEGGDNPVTVILNWRRLLEGRQPANL